MIKKSFTETIKWQQIQEEYLHHDLTVNALCKKHSIKPHQLYRKARLQNWPLRKERRKRGLDKKHDPMGIEQAAKFGKGEVGPLTRNAANTIDLPTALDRYAEIRRQHYISLPHFKTFGKGWLKRLSNTLAEAKKYLHPNYNQPVSPKKENEPMTHQQKWWGESLTIWGAIVTALSTVLPVIGPFFGLDITSQMIEQFGQNIAQLIQIIGGLTGTSMTIVGRVRAQSTISRRHFDVKL